MDRDADFVCVKVAAVDKAHIVSRHDGQTARFRQFHRRVQIAFFIRPAGADQLEKIAIREVFFIKRDTLIYQRAVTTQRLRPTSPMRPPERRINPSFNSISQSRSMIGPAAPYPR